MVTKHLLLITVVLAALTNPAASQDRHSGEFETLEGTWNVEITPIGCGRE